MKKLTIAALLLAAVGAASAQAVRSQDDHYWFANAVSTKSRAQVVAELAQARASGEFDRLTSEVGSLNDTVKSTKTRDEVRRELAEARANGEYDRLNSESYFTQQQSALATKVVSTRASSTAQ